MNAHQRMTACLLRAEQYDEEIAKRSDLSIDDKNALLYQRADEMHDAQLYAGIVQAEALASIAESLAWFREQQELEYERQATEDIEATPRPSPPGATQNGSKI